MSQKKEEPRFATVDEALDDLRSGRVIVILDDQAYHYMQMLQKPAYLRTTATILTRLDYKAMAQAFGVAYTEIASNAELEAKLRGAVCHDGPVLVRVVTDYGKRKVRWVEAVRDRYTKELTAAHHWVTHGK